MAVEAVLLEESHGSHVQDISDRKYYDRESWIDVGGYATFQSERSEQRDRHMTMKSLLAEGFTVYRNDIP